MSDKNAFTRMFEELDSIANAAMTEREREMRAAPVLAGAGLSAADLATAAANADLAWNVQKAAELGISVKDWLLALDIAGIRDCTDVSPLLGVIHRAESAAVMVRSGYKPTRDERGALSWSR